MFDRSFGTPPDAVVSDGQIATPGVFATPIRNVNLRDAHIAGWPGGLNRLRLKEWQHFLVVTDDIALSFAAVHAGYLRLGWLQIVDRRTGQRWEHHRQSPFLDVGMADGLSDARTHLHSRGLSIDIHNHLEGERHEVSLSAVGSADAPEVGGTLVCHHRAGNQPLEAIIPFGRNRALWTHKSVLPVSGELRIGDRTVLLEESRAHAILDLHKGFYPRHSWWHWATFAWRDPQGRLIGANLTRNVAGDEVHECAIWVDGRLMRLAPAVFDLRSEDWKAKTLDDRTELKFTGLGERREDLNYGLVVSRFRQRYGLFAGTVGPEEGSYRVENAFGVMEDHTATW